MENEQFKAILAELKMISLTLAILVAQGQKREPLTGEELDECQTNVIETAKQLIAKM